MNDLAKSRYLALLYKKMESVINLKSIFFVYYCCKLVVKQTLLQHVEWCELFSDFRTNKPMLVILNMNQFTIILRYIWNVKTLEIILKENI